MKKIPSIQWGRREWLAAIAALLITGVCVVSILLHRQSSPFPPVIAKQVSYISYYPGTLREAEAKRATYTGGVLRFSAVYEGVQLSFSEQATPEVFNDVPQYYSTLLTKMGQYTNFGSAMGTVYLTKPPELKGVETAVVNTNGTLLFVRPDKQMSIDQWRHLFNGLEMAQ